jgi:hypothetical protein
MTPADSSTIGADKPARAYADVEEYVGQGFLCEYPIARREPDDAGNDRPSPMMTELARNPVKVNDGFAAVPDGPGLGIDLDEEAVSRYTIDSP